jgi:hypothetical protein
MKLRLSIDDENGSRQYDATDFKALRDAANLLLSIADAHDADNRYRPGSVASIDRVDLEVTL